MDYKYWCRFLEPENLIKWETELIIQGRVNHIEEKHFDSFNNFINYTLNWSDTKDGHDYWSYICTKSPSQLIDYSQEQERYFY